MAAAARAPLTQRECAGCDRPGLEGRASSPPVQPDPGRDTFIADCETPVSAFLKLRALRPTEPAFLLESAEQGQRVGRWSFIGVRPRAVLRWSLATAAIRTRSRPSTSPAPPGAAAPTLPPFAGGAVGFFGYDLVRTVEPLGEPDPDPLGLPDMALMLSDALVVFDHLKHTITILANADLEAEPDLERAPMRGAARRSPRSAARSPGPVPRGRAAAGRGAREMPSSSRTCPAPSSKRWSSGSSSTSTPATRSRSCPPSAGRASRRCEAFSIYRGLRAVNPSPYMYYLDFGDFQIAGASPEPLLTVSRPRDVAYTSRSRARARAGRTRRGRRASPRSCWRTRRSAPST